MHPTVFEVESVGNMVATAIPVTAVVGGAVIGVVGLEEGRGVGKLVGPELGALEGKGEGGGVATFVGSDVGK